MKTKSFYLAILAMLSSPAISQVKPIELFRCNTGLKSAEIVLANNSLVYRYGKAGSAPDIEIRSNGSDGLVEKSSGPMNHQYSQELIFKNGNYKYSLQEWGNSLTLSVEKGTDVIISKDCNNGSHGFSTTTVSVDDLNVPDAK